MPFKHVFALHVFTDQEQVKSKSSYIGILSTTKCISVCTVTCLSFDSAVLEKFVCPLKGPKGAI